MVILIFFTTEIKAERTRIVMLIGEHCINPCILDPCGRHGSCFSSGRDVYRCSCDDGWIGDHCDQRMSNNIFYLLSFVFNFILNLDTSMIEKGNRKRKLSGQY